MKVIVGDAGLPDRDGVVTVSSLGEAAAVLDSTRGRDVLLVSGPAELERSSRIARTALARGDVALVVLGGHRTARTILAACLLALPADRYGSAPGVVAAAAPLVRTRLALTSVARLAEPAPSLLQHIVGWVPSTVFDVDVTGGHVHTTKEITWTAAEGDFIAWEASKEQRRLPVTLAGPAPAITLTAPTQAPPWRARSWVAMSSVDRAPEQLLADILPRLPGRACPMCHRAADAAWCLYCGHVLTHDPQGALSPMSASARGGAAR
ncbi:hypothetical protein [Georgenia sp. SYP-B2076]|uniref:hypothetical protein n=1 Tax=Georgenia sp. SYP-B2076 TaxID=2495881 RepID=UPI000F8F5026|nr:hypothetical protein [Georgenia sp. SYP-B2076]